VQTGKRKKLGMPGGEDAVGSSLAETLKGQREEVVGQYE